MQNYKNINLIGGGEEGFSWYLVLEAHEKTKIFAGHFVIEGILQKSRTQTRSKDREFFITRLGGKYMSDKVLHHLWFENNAEYSKVTVLHKNEHPNGGMDLLKDKALWIEKEKWL